MTREQMIDEAVRKERSREDLQKILAWGFADNSIFAMSIRAEFRRIQEREALRCPTCHSLTLSPPDCPDPYVP